MAIKRMNHAVLYVRDAEKTYAFYRDVFGFRVVMEMPGAKFLQAPDSDNDHDLGLFSIGDEAGASTAGRSAATTKPSPPTTFTAPIWSRSPRTTPSPC